MLDTLFLFAAVIGGAVMVCQFLLTLLGMGDEGADFGDSADIGGDVVDAGGDFGDGGADVVEGDHHTSWGEVDDVDVQHPDSSGLFAIISFRTVVAAIAFFGISGAACRSADMAVAPSLLVAVAGGAAAMYGTYYLLQLIVRLNSSGNLDIANAIGQMATVYVPIPPSRGGAGKVQFSMQQRIVEFPAVTDDDQKLKTGEAVEVVAVNGRDTVEVRRIAQTVDA
ncbi:hypothetical protein OAS39_12540 [Pirellulales bacterium]|nr:hypothetical protein [Pirellulales bacterium]